jgi:hypothetical protein
MRPAPASTALLVLAWLAAWATARAAEPDTCHRGLDLAGWPILSYSNDFGLLGGGYLDLFDWGPGEPPDRPGRSARLYRWRVGAQVVTSAGAVQEHFLRVDLPRLGGGPLRLQGWAGFSRYPDDRYFGVGDATAWDPGWERQGDPAFRDGDYTHFTLTRPWARLQARVALGGPWAALGGVHGEWSRVEAPAGSLLEAERPDGFGGGWNVMALLGALYDSRDHEALPTRGLLAALTLRGAGPFLGGAYGFGGGDLTLRGFLPLSPRLVLALRGALDAVAGHVPFLEMAAFRDYEPFQGLGGGTSLRGYPRRRFVGPLKAVANLEVRWMPVSFTLWRQRFDLGGVAFGDAGRVWSKGYDGGWRAPWLGLHATTGLGLRAAWDEHTVIRADMGFSSEATSLDLLIGQMF